MAATAEFDFIRPADRYKTEKPYWLFIGKPSDKPDIRMTNVEYERVSGIPMHDARGHESEFSLEQQGFQYVEHGQPFTAFDDRERIIGEYLPQVEQLLMKQLPYADRVFVYDWRTRKESADTDEAFISPAQIERQGFMLAPAELIHADSTEFSLVKRVKEHFPDEAGRLLEGRVQIINFWRPMYNTVYNYPLVTCDARTVNMERLIAVDQVYRHFVGDVYYAPYDSSYKWHYLRKMGAHEGVLFKSWDTAPGRSPAACIHASTALPLEVLPERYEPRMSIECRALVFSK